MNSSTWDFSATSPSSDLVTRAGELRLPVSIVRLLERRGFQDVAAISSFLWPRLRELSDPFLLAGMRPAVERIFQAVDRHERIVLYGDYDVDGITSITLLARVLGAYGIAPALFLPMRVEEGYGLTADGVARCLQTHQPQLLIALDCGTSSAERIAEIEAAGVDVLVIDHHEVQHSLPRCRAFINPKTGADHRYFCTVGLVFKLCHALLKERRLPDFDLKQYLDLVAIGTIADLVPLVAENRVLVYHGLKQLETTQWIGVKALMRVAGINFPVRPDDVGFRLGPRLNAAGRLGLAEAALNLLMTSDDAVAAGLAAELDQQNRARQQLEQETFEAACQLLEQDPDFESHCAIVVGETGWHPGVVGIVAARLVRQYYRPTLVIGFDEAGIGKGSGRSIPGFSLVQALDGCCDALTQYGGHEMAAGFSLPSEQLTVFTGAFRAFAKKTLSPEQLSPKLRIDTVVSGNELNYDFLVAHELLQPFGLGNCQPLLLLQRAEPTGEVKILKEKHRVFGLRHSGRLLRAIEFNFSEPLPAPPWDIAFYLEPAVFRDQIQIQLRVEGIRPSGSG
ncbi:MAG: single-stranded-DNA-specific exonuclease RecJ [Verrucomicrobia bacterium]|nr:single-stranded-DNA-specific exonuclease RecJ [Verrucomicrobiota bacterium]